MQSVDQFQLCWLLGSEMQIICVEDLDRLEVDGDESKAAVVELGTSHKKQLCGQGFPTNNIGRLVNGIIEAGEIKWPSRVAHFLQNIEDLADKAVTSYLRRDLFWLVILFLKMIIRPKGAQSKIHTMGPTKQQGTRGFF